jgi:L-lactate dehydrogenase complex protein LldF
MLLNLRRQAAPTHAPRWLRFAMKAFASIAARPRAYRVAMGILRRVLRRRAVDGWITYVPGPARAWTDSRDLVVPAPKSFQQAWRDRGRE